MKGTHMNTEGLILVDGRVYQEKPAHNKYGYRVITVNGRKEFLHRVIYTLHHGSIPEGKEIDHINRNKSDNRIENLRAVSRSENNRNKEVRGYYKQDGKYRAQISINNINQNLGLYVTECAARLAYLMAKLKISLS